METLKNLDSVQLLAIALFLVGIALRYAVGKRLFDRTNYYGVQRYRNYGQKVALTILEKLVSLIGMLMLLFAILLFLISSANKATDNKHSKEKAQHAAR